MQLLLKILRIYKRWISPMLPSACRFYPSCSEFMMEAIETHGVLRGVGLGIWRLLRCHPFHPGGFDPVPPLTRRRETPPQAEGLNRHHV